MDVLIVSKTHMTSSACIGGVLANGRFVRLLDEYGHNQDGDTPINIGDVCSIEFTEREHKRPPHVEDILVKKLTCKASISNENMPYFIREKINVKIWEGNTEVLFDNKIQWTPAGSGYISEAGEIPNQSVGFWVPDNDLVMKSSFEKVRYYYNLSKKMLGMGLMLKNWKSLAYVGFDKPIKVIPAGTLCRVSLARWWTPNDDEERCYLQLSGWYGLPEVKDELKDESESDDLPF